MQRTHGAEEQDSLARSTEHLGERSAELTERRPPLRLFGGMALKTRAMPFAHGALGIVSHETPG